MDLLGVQADLAKAQADLNQALDRIEKLEAQSAKDVSSITDGLKSAIVPEVQAARQSIDTAIVTVNSAVTEILALARRLDGATVTTVVHLSPEVLKGTE